MITNDIRFSLSNRLSAELEKYLEQKYNRFTKLIPFDLNDRENYLKKLDDTLPDSPDLEHCNFILPNGKLKRLKFDLSDFDIKDIYRIKLDVSENNIDLKCNVAHQNVKYFGFDLSDILKAGCVRKGGYNLVKNELFVYYNPIYYMPNNKIMDIIEEILMSVDNVCVCYEDYTNEEEYYQFFSKHNGDTIKDIKKMIYQTPHF